MLNNKFFDYFSFADVFDYERGRRLVSASQVSGDIAYISSSAVNNGVDNYIDPPSYMKVYNNKLTLSNSGSVGYLFYHDYDFVASDHVMVVWPRGVVLNKYIAMFLKPIFEAIKYKYNFGREINESRLLAETLLLPVNINGEPDWDFMTDYIKELEVKVSFENIKTKNVSSGVLPNVLQWGSFLVSDLFYVSGTKTTKIEDLEIYGSGQYPYVTTQSSNNGVAGFYNYYTEEGNVLVVDSAVVGFCSYQGENFSASDHVEKLKPRFVMNKYIGLFLSAMINQENYKYSYGRKFNQKNIRNTVIKLPVDENGNPDWVYMENYIKSLPYSDLI